MTFSRSVLASAFFVTATMACSADVVEKPLPVTAQIPRNGDFLGFGFDSIWLMSGSRLARVNPADNTVIDIPVKGTMGRLRAFQIGEQAVWLPDVAADMLFKVDPTSNVATTSVAVPMEAVEASIGAGLGSIWVVADGHDGHVLLRLNSDTGSKEAEIILPGVGAGVLVAFESVWITAPLSNAVYRVDPVKNVVTQTIQTTSKPRFLTADDHSIWVAEHGGYLQGIDGKTGKVAATIETGLDEAGSIDAGGGFVWITTHTLPLLQVDPKTNAVVARFHAKDIGAAVRYGAGSIWISGPAIHRVDVSNR